MAAIQNFTDMIRNQQSKQHLIMTTHVQLHQDNMAERQGLALYLDQQLKQQLELFQDQQEMINEESRR